MKRWLITLAMGVLPIHGAFSGNLSEKVWNHGSEDCASNRDPAIEVFEFDAATYILRQNKCVHFEAPFIYVLFGKHTVFVQDTGATADPDRFPLHDVVRGLVAEQGNQAEGLHILVTHSHSHSDHTAGDAQFRGKPGVTLIEPDAAAVREYFGFDDWPEGMTTIDLGERKLVVIPAPGHQGESLAVYDFRTGWLLTGDILYPGRLYVKDWTTYRSSVRRLVEFSKTHRISAVMGTHIEMSSKGKLFPRGSTFHPDEAGLALTLADLRQLDDVLRLADEEPKEIATANFVVSPIGITQRVLGSILKALGFR
ncbi:MAG: MBL fold metallo-hydrolase [Gammaproteobacteria bacterium]